MSTRHHPYPPASRLDGLGMALTILVNEVNTMIPLIIQLISGAVGGNIAGAILKNFNLGPIGNSIAGPTSQELSLGYLQFQARS